MNNCNNSSPWLSIIIPVYNAERYISKCIGSILSQTFSDYEIIKEGLNELDHEKMISYITGILNLPSFISAR